MLKRRIPEARPMPVQSFGSATGSLVHGLGRAAMNDFRWLMHRCRNMVMMMLMEVRYSLSSCAEQLGLIR
jgi:hypothetical protein